MWIKKSATSLGIVAAGACLVIWLSLLPQPVSAGEKSLPSSSPQVVPAAAFSRNGKGQQDHRTDGGVVSWYGPSSEVCLKAPVQLPLGARVTSLWAALEDTSTSDNAVVRLERLSYGTGDATTMGSVFSTGSNPGTRILLSPAIVERFVDHRENAYYLTLCLYEDTSFYAAGVSYEETLIFTDRFERGDTSRWSSAAVKSAAIEPIAHAPPPIAAVPEALQERLAEGGFPSVAVALDTITSSMKAAGYNPPLVIPAADLVPQVRFMDFEYVYPGGYAKGVNTVNLYGPALLPEGATVTSAFAVVYDNEPGSDPLYDETSVSLRRTAPSTGMGDDLARMSTSGASSEVQVILDLSVTNALVDYPGYTYNLGVSLPGPDHRFYALIVYYTPGT